MKIRMRADDFSIDGLNRLEVALGMEDFFAMLDGVSHKTMADYMAHRLRSTVEQSAENRNGSFHAKTGGVTW